MLSAVPGRVFERWSERQTLAGAFRRADAKNMVDEATGEKYARAEGSKGVGEGRARDWLIKDMAEELKSRGRSGDEGGHIIVKKDGDKSIVAVRDASAKVHGGKVVQESPPRGESQSNGTVEQAGRTVREFARVLKELMEDKAGVVFKREADVVLWMIRWAAMLCFKFLVGKDGFTADGRRKGRKCQVPTLSFGEKVWCKELRVGKDRKNNMDSEWHEGLWGGHNRKFNGELVGARVELLREPRGDGSQVGRLRMSLCGARDAAANSQEEVRELMQGCGFVRAAYNPRLHWHRDNGLRTLVNTCVWRLISSRAGGDRH